MQNFFNIPELDLIEVRNHKALKGVKLLMVFAPVLVALCLSIFFWTDHINQSIKWTLIISFCLISLLVTLFARYLLNVLVNNVEFSLKQVKQSKEHFRLLADSIPELVSVADGKGKALWYNDAWYRYTGSVPVEKIEGTSKPLQINWKHVHDPTYFPIVFQKWKVGVESRNPFEIQFPLRGDDGKYRRFQYRATPVKDKNGEVIFWFGTSTDIESEMIQMEHEKFLKEANIDLNDTLEADVIFSSLVLYTIPNLIDGAVMLLFEKDDRGKILKYFVSPEYDDFGRDLFEPQLLEDLLTKIQLDTLHIKKVQTIDISEKTFSSLTVFPLFCSGKLRGVYLFFLKSGRQVDPRRLKVLSELTVVCSRALTNAQLHLDLKEAVATRDDFISIASHELKTPLTSLLLQIQIIERKVLNGNETDPELVESMSFCRNQTLKLANLVNQLFDTAHIRSGKVQLHRVKMDLSLQIEEVCRRFESEIQGKGVKLEWTRSTPVIGHWDPIRLDQIVSNLLSNALKYGNRQPITIDLQLFEEKREVQFKIRDRGYGIPKALQTKIFERFSRAAADPQSRGLGLGLYICKQLVLAHKGKIEVKSTVGLGSEFIVTLPI